jgi:hypothetical protein
MHHGRSKAASEIRLLANPNVDGAKIWRNFAPVTALLFGRIDNLENADRPPFVLRDKQLPPRDMSRQLGLPVKPTVVAAGCNDVRFRIPMAEYR